MTKDVKTTNKNINSLPEIDKKVNAMATLTPIIKSESEKIDETGRNSVLGKVLSFVEGKVEASAGRCSNQYSIWGKNWWGITLRGSRCFGQDVYQTFAISTAGAGLSGAVCMLSAILAGAGVLVCGVFMGAWWMISYKGMKFGEKLEEKARQCGGWATADVRYTTSFTVKC